VVVTFNDQFKLGRVKRPPVWTPPKHESLVDQTVRSLLHGLNARMWNNELPGERTLCELLSVSRPTLRAALEQLERTGLLYTTRGRRRRIVQHSKSKLAGATQKKVALLTPIPLDAFPPFVLNWIDLLRTRLAQERITLEIHCTPRCYGRFPGRALAAQLARTPASFWILFRSTLPMQRWFEQRRVGCVLAGSPFTGIALPSVDIDYRAACRHAGSLLRNRGHKRVCLLLPEGTHGGDVESIKGLAEGFADDSLVVLHHDNSREEIVACVDEALRLQPRVRAFVVARSAPVLSVVTRLLQCRFKMPDDVSVIARDDDAHMEFLTPQVTRYSVSSAVFGRYVSSLCLRAVRGLSTTPRTRKLIPRLIPGETV
jgi:DNA-binding LacI/PurR family transcriptional regulator